MRITSLWLAGLVLGLAACNLSGQRRVTIRVDTTRTYQTMSGWEASESFDWALPPSVMDSLIRTAVYDLGINRLRHSLPGNMIEGHDTTTMPQELRLGTNDNDDPTVVNPAGFRWELPDRQTEQFVLPMARYLKEKGEPFVLTATYVGYRETAQYQQRDPAEYVEFMLVVLDHFRDTYGIIPDLWEVRLEPDHGRRPLAAHQQGVLLAAAARAARAAGYQDLRFTVPSTAVPHRANAWMREIVAIPGNREAIAEFGFHRYTPPPPDTLTSIRDYARELGLPTAMLEFARGGVRELYQDLTLADVTVWSRFSLAGSHGGPDSGGQYFYVDTTEGTFRYRETTWPLRQYFHFIRPGAVRVEAGRPSGGVEPVAFRRPNGGYVVVANTSGPVTLDIRGLPAGDYRVSWASLEGPAPETAATTRSDGSLLVTVPRAATVSVFPTDRAR